MEKAKKKRIINPKKLIAYLPIVIVILGVLFLITVIWQKKLGAFEEVEATVLTESTLIDTVDIADLSTAEFTYNGIADIYKSEKPDEIKCRVRYEAKVKASVNMEDIKFTVDDENMTVKPTLPKIKFKAVLDDQEGFSFIPEDSNVDIQEVVKICKEDVTNEANQTSELYDSAEENLKDVIEALTLPIINSKGYTLIWE